MRKNLLENEERPYFMKTIVICEKMFSLTIIKLLIHENIISHFVFFKKQGVRGFGFINNLKTNVTGLLGLGPNTTEITGKFIETVKQRNCKFTLRSLQLY